MMFTEFNLIYNFIRSVVFWPQADRKTDTPTHREAKQRQKGREPIDCIRSVSRYWRFCIKKGQQAED